MEGWKGERMEGYSPIEEWNNIKMEEWMFGSNKAPSSLEVHTSIVYSTAIPQAGTL